MFGGGCQQLRSNKRGQMLSQGETFTKSVTPLEALEAANGESNEHPQVQQRGIQVQ